MYFYCFLITLFFLSSSSEALKRHEVIANALKYRLSLITEQKIALTQFYIQLRNQGLLEPEAVLLARLSLQNLYVANNPRFFARLSRMLGTMGVTLSDRYALFQLALEHLDQLQFSDSDAELAFYSTTTYISALAEIGLQRFPFGYRTVEEFPIVPTDEPEPEDAMMFLIQNRVRQFSSEELQIAEMATQIFLETNPLQTYRSRFHRAMAVVRLRVNHPDYEPQQGQFLVSLQDRLSALQGEDLPQMTEAEHISRENHLITTVIAMRRRYSILHEGLIEEGVQRYNSVLLASTQRSVLVTPSKATVSTHKGF